MELLAYGLLAVVVLGMAYRQAARPEDVVKRLALVVSAAICVRGSCPPPEFEGSVTCPAGTKASWSVGSDGLCRVVCVGLKRVDA